MTLPKSPSDLIGKMAARWIRESTPEQEDNYGPDSQHRNIDMALDRTGMVDSGKVYKVTHSGKTVWQSETMAEMRADARAGRFDVLVTGYSDRWQRNITRTLMILEDDLHPAGVAVYFADTRILSSDPSDWDALVREAHDSDRYTRRLAQKISDGHAAKWRKYHDPPGYAPLGYNRASEKPRLLQIDPDEASEALRLYERYALGNVSMDDLANDAPMVRRGPRKGNPMTREGIADLLSNPIYRGEVSYIGSSDPEDRPDLRIVPDELWYRVQEAMQTRTSGGGPHKGKRADLTGGYLYCHYCGTRLRSDGYAKAGKPRKRHPNPCPQWGKTERRYAALWEGPIMAQIGGLDLSPETIALISAAIGSPPPLTDAVGRKRLERERRLLREAFDAGRVEAAEFVSRAAHLDEQTEALLTAPDAAEGPSPEEAEAYLRDFAQTWRKANTYGLGSEQADMLHAIYQRVEVGGSGEFLDLKLTPEAERYGLSLALPEQVTAEQAFGADAVLACPRGLEPPTFRSAT